MNSILKKIEDVYQIWNNGNSFSPNTDIANNRTHFEGQCSHLIVRSKPWKGRKENIFLYSCTNMDIYNRLHAAFLELVSLKYPGLQFLLCPTSITKLREIDNLQSVATFNFYLSYSYWHFRTGKNKGSICQHTWNTCVSNIGFLMKSNRYHNKISPFAFLLMKSILYQWPPYLSYAVGQTIQL